MPSWYNLLMVTEILRPATFQEALKARGTPGSAFLGGGTWLNASLSAKPLILISLEKLGLDSIEPGEKRCVIGATASFQKIVDHPAVPDALREAASLTGSRTLRNMTTLGGEVALRSPDSAVIPVLIAMGAEVSIAGKKESIPIQNFISDKDGDLIVSVAIPDPGRLGVVLVVSRTSHSPRGLVVAASASSIEPRITNLRLVAADCVRPATRLSKLEWRLEGRTLPPRSEIEEEAGGEFSPQPDIHASSTYKRYMTRVLVADALLQMSGRKSAP